MISNDCTVYRGGRGRGARPARRGAALGDVAWIGAIRPGLGAPGTIRLKEPGPRPIRRKIHPVNTRFGDLMRPAVALLAIVLAACNAAGTSPANPSSAASLSIPPYLGVSNGTALTVTLVVNGQRVGEFPAGGPLPSIDAAALPPLPWNVQALSPSGRVLASMTVRPGQLETRTLPGGAVERSIPMGRVDLSCGRLTIWAGDFPPSGPVPPASPGTLGDCAP
jgi:hypothetical protein